MDCKYICRECKNTFPIKDMAAIARRDKTCDVCTCLLIKAGDKVKGEKIGRGVDITKNVYTDVMYGELRTVKKAYVKNKLQYWECFCTRCDNTITIRDKALIDKTMTACKSCMTLKFSALVEMDIYKDSTSMTNRELGDKYGCECATAGRIVQRVKALIERREKKTETGIKDD